MRVLALDIGQKRVGLAVSDASGSVALPLCVLPYHEVIAHSRPFRLVFEDYDIDQIVVGKPTTLTGEKNAQVMFIEESAQMIQKNTQLPIAFVDERYSSKQAKTILREAGLSEKKMRGKLDCVAASIFLQTWLDAAKNQRNQDESKTSK